MNTYLYGCGGHAKVILDIFQQNGQKVTALVDDNPPAGIRQIYNTPIYLASEVLAAQSPENSQWIIAIGNNSIRKKIALKLSEQGYSFTTAIHPSARMGLGVKILPGTVVMANAVINPDTQVGSHVIINTGAIIDHDCQIGNYSHISPGCCICGHVKIGENVLLGAGSSISPLTQIGDDVVCSPGSTIIDSLPEI